MSTQNDRGANAPLVPPVEKKVTMRNHWFEHVAKTRKKLSRAQKKPVSHRDAMREASATWGSIKDRVRKKMLRSRKNNSKPTRKNISKK